MKRSLGWVLFFLTGLVVGLVAGVLVTRMALRDVALAADPTLEQTSAWRWATYAARSSIRVRAAP